MYALPGPQHFQGSACSPLRPIVAESLRTQA